MEANVGLLNWDSVILVGAVVGIIVYLIKTGQMKILKQLEKIMQAVGLFRTHYT